MKYHFVGLVLAILLAFALPGLAERVSVGAVGTAPAAEAVQTGELPVTAMFNGQERLGYDRASGTFYCSLGLDTGAQWPELSLSGETEPGTVLCWAEDPTQVPCDEAIRSGRAFEMTALTDQGAFPFSVVFTGLPILTLDTRGAEIVREDVPASFSVSAPGTEPLEMRAEVHLHGGTYYRGYDKWSYRVELHETNEKGKDKTVKRSLLGLPEDSDWYLLGNSFDISTIKNQICWEIWRDWNDQSGITMLDGRMTELFVNDEYVGIYQLMQKIRPKQELLAMGGSLETDAVIRKVRHESDRPTKQVEGKQDYIAELRWAPEKMTSDEAFACFDMFMLLDDVDYQKPLNKEEFSEAVRKHFDLREAISYFLFIQCCGFGMDNVDNNVYIWATRQEDGSYRYHLSPWDMDSAFIRIDTNGDRATADEGNLWMGMFNRIFGEEVEGARDILWDTWNEKRAGLLAKGQLEARIRKWTDVINRSGAYRREREKWFGESKEYDPTEMIEQSEGHLDTVAYYIAELWPRGRESATDNSDYTREIFGEALSKKKLLLLLGGAALAAVLVALAILGQTGKKNEDPEMLWLLLGQEKTKQAEQTPMNPAGMPEIDLRETEDYDANGTILNCAVRIRTAQTEQVSAAQLEQTEEGRQIVLWGSTRHGKLSERQITLNEAFSGSRWLLTDSEAAADGGVRVLARINGEQAREMLLIPCTQEETE